MRLAMAGVSGAAGGVVGAPADMVNVRMQNDIKLPIDSDQRRNYKHAIDGLIRIIREEGVMKVISICITNCLKVFNKVNKFRICINITMRVK